MIRLLESRGVMSVLLSAIVGLGFYFTYPFPEHNLFLSWVRIGQPQAYLFLKSTWILFLFTTPLFLFNITLSLLYIFSNGIRRKKAGVLPPYPDPISREQLELVLGEVQNPTQAAPGEKPYWLTIPRKGLFTGIAVFGNVGSGKTAGAMYPYAWQLLSWKAHDPKQRMGALVLEVKGDFCHKVKRMLKELKREEDYVEVGLDSDYVYNPLHNDQDAYALAYAVASLLTNLFGRGKEPFWQQAYTNLVKFLILLHKVVYRYVTFLDIYRCAINEALLEKRIEEGRALFGRRSWLLFDPDQLKQHPDLVSEFKPRFDRHMGFHKVQDTPTLVEFCSDHGIGFEPFSEANEGEEDTDRAEMFRAVEEWYLHDWRKIDSKLRTSIVEGISVFLSLFADNPKVMKRFCPPKEAYEPQVNSDGRFGIPLPDFSEMIRQGKVVALNFPINLNPGLARALGTMLKMDFQRAVLARIPDIESDKDHGRPVMFMCDEYQAFATTGESDPSGDEKFFGLSRQARLIPIVATQSISSLKSTLSGNTWETLVQNLRTKVIMASSDAAHARWASELCGREDKLKVHYNIHESGQDSKVSFLFGKSMSHRSSLGTGKSLAPHREPKFDQHIFSELANMQSVVLAYDGRDPHPASYCYLKPYYLDPNMSYFEQRKRGLV